MKRFIAMLFALLLALNLCACDANAPTTDPTETTVVTTPTDTSVSTETTEIPEDTTATTDTTDLSVVYDSFVITEDYEGKPALIVFMTWTNTTEDTTMFATEYSVAAFQNGIGLDAVCIIMKDEYTEALGATMTEIRPGATIAVAQSFLLKDTTSKIEIEIDEWISFDDEVLFYLEVDPTAVG